MVIKNYSESTPPPLPPRAHNRDFSQYKSIWTTLSNAEVYKN